MNGRTIFSREWRRFSRMCQMTSSVLICAYSRHWRLPLYSPWRQNPGGTLTERGKDEAGRVKDERNGHTKMRAMYAQYGEMAGICMVFATQSVPTGIPTPSVGTSRNRVSRRETSERRRPSRWNQAGQSGPNVDQTRTKLGPKVYQTRTKVPFLRRAVQGRFLVFKPLVRNTLGRFFREKWTARRRHGKSAHCMHGMQKRPGNEQSWATEEIAGEA